MKRIFIFVLLVVSMLGVACNDKENEIKVVITSASEVQLGMYGEDVTITYNIKGAQSGAIADVALSDKSWVRVKEHTAGTLVVGVADNDNGGSRMAAVTLSYGGSLATMIINQSSETVAPTIVSLSGEEINIGRAGTKVQVEYELENTNLVDYIYVKTAADWIYSIDTNTKGVVELGVATNETKALREAIVTVGYGVASFNITLKQAGDGDIDMVATVLSGDYYGDALTPGAANYWLILSDRGFNDDGTSKPNATYYRIDAYGAVYNGVEPMVPIANGTYTFDKDNTYACGTFTAEYSGHWVTNKDARRDEIKAFESGVMVVENNKITLDVVVDGEEHHVVYEGDTALWDESGSVVVYSTLDGDYHADLSDHTLIYECYGDYYEFGYTNWMFVIVPNDGDGDCFQFDFITGYTTPEEGFVGDYVSSDILAKWSFIPGWTDQTQLQCSWFFTADQSEVAPFRGGNMSVKENGDGTMTVDIEVKDDLRNAITGTWTGVPMSNK